MNKRILNKLQRQLPIEVLMRKEKAYQEYVKRLEKNHIKNLKEAKNELQKKRMKKIVSL